MLLIWCKYVVQLDRLTQCMINQYDCFMHAIVFTRISMCICVDMQIHIIIYCSKYACIVRIVGAYCYNVVCCTIVIGASPVKV